MKHIYSHFLFRKKRKTLVGESSTEEGAEISDNNFSQPKYIMRNGV
ncbi:hypothetical protein EZS27_018051 [termite gut metagenome]|uniref:Uncharacterized protein n=1 Tax=termite gut metagenome TaxID=433724 RepID=A0A5J4RJ12_9ZZZZ